MKKAVSVANLSDGSDVFSKADPVIKVECFVILNIAEDLLLAEIYEHCVLLDLETIYFQKDAALVPSLAVLLILHSIK